MSVGFVIPIATNSDRKREPRLSSNVLVDSSRPSPLHQPVDEDVARRKRPCHLCSRSRSEPHSLCAHVLRLVLDESFSSQLNLLTESLGKTNSHFIRCVKPSKTTPSQLYTCVRWNFHLGWCNSNDRRGQEAASVRRREGHGPTSLQRHDRGVEVDAVSQLPGKAILRFVRVFFAFCSEGFPTRCPFDDLYNRYHSLMPPAVQQCESSAPPASAPCLAHAR